MDVRKYIRNRVYFDNSAIVMALISMPLLAVFAITSTNFWLGAFSGMLMLSFLRFGYLRFYKYIDIQNEADEMFLRYTIERREQEKLSKINDLEDMLSVLSLDKAIIQLKEIESLFDDVQSTIINKFGAGSTNYGKFMQPLSLAHTKIIHNMNRLAEAEKVRQEHGLRYGEGENMVDELQGENESLIKELQELKFSIAQTPDSAIMDTNIVFKQLEDLKENTKIISAAMENIDISNRV